MMKAVLSPSLVATQILIKSSESKKVEPKIEDLKTDSDSSSLDFENSAEKI
jgi:hypothetical protein